MFSGQGGALRSESWRSNLDLLLINIVTNSLKEGWASKEKSYFRSNEPTEIWADMQLAALRALLASFLSSSRVRSPYLAQGLELFRRGNSLAFYTNFSFPHHKDVTIENKLQYGSHSIIM